MFPNFTSLAQREQKRQELLERSQRRVRQANAKRDMYEGASWATDISNGITTVAKKSTESTQTDMSVGSDQPVPTEVKQTINDIIDQVIAQSDLKKTLNSENSDINPEVSTTGTNTESNVRLLSDVKLDGVSIPPVQKPLSDVSIEGISIPSVESPTPSVNDEKISQTEFKKAVAEIFDLYPILARMRIHPLSSNGRQLTKYYIGIGAKTYDIRLIRIVSVPSINWEETYEHIGIIITNDVRFIAYQNEKRELGEMGKEDRNAPHQVWERLIGNKRSLVKEPTDYKLSEQRLDDSFLVDNSSSTHNDQIDSKLKMYSIINKNKELLISNGLMKTIIPILKGTNKSTPFDANGYIWIKGSTINVFGKETDRIKPAITEKVNWSLSLKAFVDMVRERGLELEMNADDKEIDAKDFTEGEGEARQGTMSGIDEDMDQKLSNADNDAKKILTDYYTGLNSNGVKIPFRLKPIVDTKGVVKTHPDYYFSEPSETKPLNIRNGKHKQVSGEALKGLMKSIRWMDTFISLLDGFDELNGYLTDVEYPFPSNDKEAAKLVEDKKLDQQRRKNLDDNLKILNEALMSTGQDIRRQSIEPYVQADNEEQLQYLHEDSERAYQDYGEAQKRYDEAKEAVKTNSSKASRSALKAATSAMRATKAVFNAKSKAYSNAKNPYVEEFVELQNDRSVRGVMNDMLNKVSGQGLKGRGLRGAGVAPLDGVVRRGRTYNLNEIQGLATPSAYTYKQLGSKYIRIPDLDAKTLVIVQPNRRKCGPKCQISDSLQGMIRTLVYKNHIDQATYDKLSIDDKKMFKEILAITHLQYNFHDKLTDPLETLRAEYDKLKGEIQLGNDNPSIIKQLKSLTVDMYSNRLIDDKEFKEIITRIL